MCWHLPKTQASQNTVRRHRKKTNPWKYWPFLQWKQTLYRIQGPIVQNLKEKTCENVATLQEWPLGLAVTRPLARPVERPVAHPVTFPLRLRRFEHFDKAGLDVRRTHASGPPWKSLGGPTKPRLTSTTILNKTCTWAFQNLAIPSEVTNSLVSMIWEHPKQWVFVHQFRQHWTWCRKSKFEDSQTAMHNQISSNHVELFRSLTCGWHCASCLHVPMQEMSRGTKHACVWRVAHTRNQAKKQIIWKFQCWTNSGKPILRKTNWAKIWQNGDPSQVLGFRKTSSPTVLPHACYQRKSHHNSRRLKKTMHCIHMAGWYWLYVMHCSQLR